MIKSRHTDEEKKQCVNEYLNGEDKYYLAGKYSTSIRTIDRWIAKMDINKVELRKIRRADDIPIDIQGEILDTLNTNPMTKEFKISIWNETMITRYIKERYNIDVNRRMAKSLIDDSMTLNNISYEDKVYNDIEELEVLGYNIVLIDYIKIGRIDAKEIDFLEIRKYTEERLDVNLVVARANDNMYLDIIISEANIIDKSAKVNIKQGAVCEDIVLKNKQQRKDIVNDKCKVLDKVLRQETNNKTIFLTKRDNDIKKIISRKNDFKFYIVGDLSYDDLRQIGYEGEYGETAIYYLNDENNRGRLYRQIRDISKTVKGKVDRYVLDATIDNYKLKNEVKDIDKEHSIIEKNKEKLRNKVKFQKTYFIHNI